MSTGVSGGGEFPRIEPRDAPDGRHARPLRLRGPWLALLSLGHAGSTGPTESGPTRSLCAPVNGFFGSMPVSWGKGGGLVTEGFDG